jgi:hypothetical protein
MSEIKFCQLVGDRFMANAIINFGATIVNQKFCKLKPELN